MTPIQRNEVLPIGEYEAIRPHFRARVIEAKKARRFQLPPHMDGVLENRDTVLLQIQEMLRTERITSESGIAHEIETYNELVPGPDQISMTCFIAIGDKALREATLEQLAGLERCFFVEVDGEALPATNTREEDIAPHRTTAVHYLKVTLPAAAVTAIRERRARVAVGVRHPRYEARAELGKATLDALADDLSTS